MSDDEIKEGDKVQFKLDIRGISFVYMVIEVRDSSALIVCDGLTDSYNETWQQISSLKKCRWKR